MNILTLYKPKQIYVHVNKQKLFIVELAHNDVSDDIDLITNIYKKMNLGTEYRYRSLEEIIRNKEYFPHLFQILL
jgi:hypothetical protein